MLEVCFRSSWELDGQPQAKRLPGGLVQTGRSLTDLDEVIEVLAAQASDPHDALAKRNKTVAHIYPVLDGALFSADRLGV